VGIAQRGRIDDDAEQFFGDRTIRRQDNRMVRLMLARTFDGGWYLSLSYQDKPARQNVTDQLIRDIHTAAHQIGLTVSREYHES